MQYLALGKSYQITNQDDSPEASKQVKKNLLYLSSFFFLFSYNFIYWPIVGRLANTQCGWLLFSLLLELLLKINRCFFFTNQIKPIRYLEEKNYAYTCPSVFSFRGPIHALLIHVVVIAQVHPRYMYVKDFSCATQYMHIHSICM